MVSSSSPRRQLLKIFLASVLSGIRTLWPCLDNYPKGVVAWLSVSPHHSFHTWCYHLISMAPHRINSSWPDNSTNSSIWNLLGQRTAYNFQTHTPTHMYDWILSTTDTIPVGERGGLPSRCRTRQNPTDHCSCPRRVDQDHWRTATDRQTQSQSHHHCNILSYRWQEDLWN